MTTRETALVTGASSGIGAAYADRLARRGFDLILVARDRVRLGELAGRLAGETGVAVEVLPADLGAADDLARVERRLAAEDGPSFLVNNAGIAGGGPIATADPDRLEAMIRLNVVAVTRLAVAIAPRLARQGRGTIVNIASVTALMPDAFEPVYPATKAYVLSLSEGLDHELRAHGVRVQAVLPGITRTAIWANAGHDVAAFPAAMVMEVDEMVDAALAGLDLGERVTIPSLPDMAEWQALVDARLRLRPGLSRSRAADRYATAGARAA